MRALKTSLRAIPALSAQALHDNLSTWLRS